MRRKLRRDCPHHCTYLVSSSLHTPHATRVGLFPNVSAGQAAAGHGHRRENKVVSQLCCSLAAYVVISSIYFYRVIATLFVEDRPGIYTYTSHHPLGMYKDTKEMNFMDVFREVLFCEYCGLCGTVHRQWQWNGSGTAANLRGGTRIVRERVV